MNTYREPSPWNDRPTKFTWVTHSGRETLKKYSATPTYAAFRGHWQANHHQNGHRGSIHHIAVFHQQAAIEEEAHYGMDGRILYVVVVKWVG